MPDTTEGKGSCLCGAIHITAKTMNNKVGACHCSMCRKWGGGPFMEVRCGSEVFFEGEEHISRFNSSKWAERGFCKQCGTHLFYRLKKLNKYMMPIGLFDDDKNFIFNHQVFIDEKPSFYNFAETTKNMTGPEVFAQYAPPSKA